MTSLYDELGIAPDATPDEIKAAHRAGAKQHHPERGGSAEKFGALQRAWEVLRDPDRRARYDQTGDDGFVSSEAFQQQILSGVAKFVSQAAAEPGDLSMVNLPARIAELLDGELKKITEAIAGHETQAKRLTEMARRMKPKKGAAKNASLVTVAIEGRKHELASELAEMRRAHDLVTQIKAVFLAQDYEWTSPPVFVQMPGGSTTNFFGFAIG